MASPYAAFPLFTEVFHSPSAYAPFVLIGSQLNTVGWCDLGVRVAPLDMGLPVGDYTAEPDKPAGIHLGVPGAETQAMRIGSAPLGTSWACIGADPATHPASGEEVMLGARRGGFYVAGEVGGNPTITLDVEILDQWSDPFTERVVLVGQTHEKQTGWASWEANFGQIGVEDATNATPIKIRTAQPHGATTGDTVTIANVLGNTAANGVRTLTVVDADEFTLDGSVGNGVYVPSALDMATFKKNHAAKPVTSAFYNPNAGGASPNDYALGAGGSANGAANWARLPVADAFQTRRAIGSWKKITLVDRSGTTADTILLAHWKTIAFGMRTPIASKEDIAGGSVVAQPILVAAAFTASAAFMGNLATLCTLFPSPVRKRVIAVEPKYNVVRFDNHPGVGLHPRFTNNPHVVSGLAGRIDNPGEMAMGWLDHLWCLYLSPRSPRRRK